MKPYYQDALTTIYHGDCREILPTLSQVDHVITDPPYSRDVYLRMRDLDATKNYGEGGKPSRGFPGIIAMRSGAIGDVNDLAPTVAPEIVRLTKRWALVFSDVEYIQEWRNLLLSGGMQYRRTGAWIKPDAMPQMTGDRPGVGFEPITIMHAKGRSKWNAGGHLGIWTHYVVKDRNKGHPCPKPLGLMQELVEDFTDSGETILDPFLGSGTTLVAAKNLGRKAIGIEIEEEWCELAARHLSQEVLPLAQGAKC